MSNAGSNVTFSIDLPKDRVPVPPADAEIVPTACDYCIVGCAYRAITWPVGKEGGPKASENAFGVDYPRTESLVGSWPSPNQHTIVLKNGEPHNCIVTPAISERVNRSANHSVRGGGIAQKCYSPWRATKDRLQQPLLRVRGVLQPIGWEDATTIAAEVGRYVFDKYGEMAYGVKAYSYQFYENTYAITKLALQSIETPVYAHHDKASAQDDASGLEDMGIDTFGPSYDDWSASDVIFISGTDPYETKTVLFTEHIMEGRPKLVMVLPRKSPGVTWAEENDGLWLQVNVGTDAILHNAMCRYIIEKGWQDQHHIDHWAASSEEIDWGMGRGTRNTPWQWRSTRWGTNFNKWTKWLMKEKYAEMDVAVKMTGIPRENIINACKILTGGGSKKRPKASFMLEKGNYWSNNYLNTISFGNLAIICGAGTRDGQVIGRAGGHQRGGVNAAGYPRSKTPERFGKIGRKALNVDNWVRSGHVRFMYVIGTNWIEAMQGSQDLADYIKDHTTGSKHQVEKFDVEHVIQTLKARADAGDMVLLNNEIYLRTIGNQFADLVMPAATWGEETFTRAQGERQLRIYSKFYDPPGDAKPDWWIIQQIAKKMGFDGYDWKTSEDVFKELARFTRNSRQDLAPLVKWAALNNKSPYDVLRKRAATGYQLPLRLHNNKLIETKRLHNPHVHIESGQGITVKLKRAGSFTKPSGKLILHKVDWNLFGDFYEAIKPKPEKKELWVTCGRNNELWQSVFDDMRKPYIMQRHPMNFVEMNPKDAADRGISNGDLVSMENDEVFVQVGGFYRARHKDFLFKNLKKDGYIKTTQGSASAMVYVTSVVPPGTTFMYFNWPGGGASNSLSPAVADPLTNAPRYKLGKAVIKKIGTLPDYLKKRMTFKEKV